VKDTEEVIAEVLGEETDENGTQVNNNNRINNTDYSGMVDPKNLFK